MEEKRENKEKTFGEIKAEAIQMLEAIDEEADMLRDRIRKAIAGLNECENMDELGKLIDEIGESDKEMLFISLL